MFWVEVWNAAGGALEAALDRLGHADFLLLPDAARPRRYSALARREIERNRDGGNLAGMVDAERHGLAVILVTALSGTGVPFSAVMYSPAARTRRADSGAAAPDHFILVGRGVDLRNLLAAERITHRLLDLLGRHAEGGGAVAVDLHLDRGLPASKSLVHADKAGRLELVHQLVGISCSWARSRPCNVY